MISMPVNVKLDKNKINKDSKSLDERGNASDIEHPSKS